MIPIADIWFHDMSARRVCYDVVQIEDMSELVQKDAVNIENLPSCIGVQRAAIGIISIGRINDYVCFVYDRVLGTRSLQYCDCQSPSSKTVAEDTVREKHGIKMIACSLRDGGTGDGRKMNEVEIAIPNSYCISS